MYFCPKCHFSLDIGKSSKTVITEKIILKKVLDIFKKIENNEDLELYKTDIKLEEITKNSKYSKLSEDAKNNINKLFEEPTSNEVEFNCTNCSYTSEIKESILLFEFNQNNGTEKVRNIDENKFMCSNNTLPRTHDYICKNNDCLTNSNKKIHKEAIFYRDSNSMKVNYICCICYYGW